MDRAILKERAKQSYHQQTGISILVAFLVTLVGGSGGGFNVNYRYNVNGNYTNANDLWRAVTDISPQIFAFIASAAVVWSFIALLLNLVVRPIVAVGGNRYFLKLRKNEVTGIAEIVGNFKDGNFGNLVLIGFLKNLFITLWSLLFVIPGIIKGLEYFAIDYILAVRPNLDRRSAFTMSRNLMNGYKGELFVLHLSFLGWDFLSALTCGILGIAFVLPYKQATYAEFFAFIREDGLRRGVITAADLPDYGFTAPQQQQPPMGGSYQAPGNTWQPFSNQPGAPQGGVNPPEAPQQPPVPPTPDFPSQS